MIKNGMTKSMISNMEMETAFWIIYWLSAAAFGLLTVVAWWHSNRPESVWKIGGKPVTQRWKIKMILGLLIIIVVLPVINTIAAIWGWSTVTFKK